MTVLQFPLSKMDRRRPDNRLRRATTEAEQLEERLIDYWLSLADVALDDSWDTMQKRKSDAA